MGVLAYAALLKTIRVDSIVIGGDGGAVPQKYAGAPIGKYCPKNDLPGTIDDVQTGPAEVRIIKCKLINKVTEKSSVKNRTAS